MVSRKSTDPEPEVAPEFVDVDEAGIGRDTMLQKLLEFQDSDAATAPSRQPLQIQVKHSGAVLEWPTLTKKTGKFLVRSIHYIKSLPVKLFEGTEFEKVTSMVHRAIRGDVVVLDVDDATKEHVDQGYLEPFKE